MEGQGSQLKGLTMKIKAVSLKQNMLSMIKVSRKYRKGVNIQNGVTSPYILRFCYILTRQLCQQATELII
jgi:hypothetical protein